MVQTIQAEKLIMYDVEAQFGLQFTDDAQFFPEWQHNLPELTEIEKQALDEVRTEFRHLSKYEIQEPIIKMVVLSPLLKIAGFFLPPFNLTAEKSVEVVSVDEETIVRGRLDLLVFVPDFWILVIEAKRLRYSLEVGMPQLLTYMLAHPKDDKPLFGFITNGPTFKFVKLIKQEQPIYSESFGFFIDREDDLYTVVRILKNLGQFSSLELRN